MNVVNVRFSQTGTEHIMNLTVAHSVRI